MPKSQQLPFIDAHVLQSVPYSALNRDDTNSLKTVEWGGVTRTRVSSQCWKYASRDAFQRLIGDAAIRTRRIGEATEHHLREKQGWPAELARRAGAHIAAGSSIKADPPGKNNPAWATNALVYVPEVAIAELAAIAERHRTQLESAPDITTGKESVLPTGETDTVLRSRNGVINLFGRMLAEIDQAGVDGAVQVAHAFATHETSTDIDYFSAVDDITKTWNDTTGSGHMGHNDYSAGVFYRYATIDLGDLLHNLADDHTAAEELTAAFLEAFALSVPHAKNTGTAPHTIPELVHLAVRTDRPVSFASAFENPVAPDHGHAHPSITELDRYATAAHRFLGGRGVRTAGWAGTTSTEPTHLGEHYESLYELIDHAVTTALHPGDTP